MGFLGRTGNSKFGGQKEGRAPMDLSWLVMLCLSGSVVTIGIGIACLVRLDNLDRKLRAQPRNPDRGHLRGKGKVLPWPGSSTPGRRR